MNNLVNFHATKMAYTPLCNPAVAQTTQHQAKHLLNEGKSVASFCLQVAAWVSDMFCNFYLAKNHKIAQNSTTTKASEKISTDVESLEF